MNDLKQALDDVRATADELRGLFETSRRRRQEALDCLSLARTALDDPSGLSVQEMAEASQFGNRVDGYMVDDQALKAYAIDKIDNAMCLLGANEEG